MAAGTFRDEWRFHSDFTSNSPNEFPDSSTGPFLDSYLGGFAIIIA